MDLLDVARLVEDLPEEAVPAGTEGAIVHILHAPTLAYEVEFTNEYGAEVTVALLPHQIAAP